MKQINEYKTYIFDLDGTLIDSMGVWHTIDEWFFERRNMELPKDYMDSVNTLNFKEAAIYTIDRFGLTDSIESIMKEWMDDAVYAYGHEIECKPYVPEYLHKLKSENKKISLATSSDKALYEAVLKRHGLYDLFDAFVTTHDVKRAKGFPDIYERSASLTGSNVNDCIVFEDLYEAITGAKMGGFTVAAVQDPFASNVSKILDISDYYIESFEKLL